MTMATLGLVLIILIGTTAVSYFISRLPAKLWMLAYVIGFTILIALNVNKYAPSLVSRGIYNFFCYGRRDYVWLGVSAISVILGCYPRLKTKNLRALVLVFLSIAVLRYSLLPFVHPMVAYAGYDQTRFSATLPGLAEDNVFIQSTEYTCGPAALVNALSRYGINDSEDNIARGTFANPYSGTQPEHMVNYINRRYGRKLSAEFSNYMKNLEQLDQPDSIFITIVKSSFFYDHYVVVLGFASDGDLLLADPSNGKQKISREDFLKNWRHQVITIKRHG